MGQAAAGELTSSSAERISAGSVTDSVAIDAASWAASRAPTTADGLGTMTWGESTEVDVATAQLSAFVDAGGTLVEPADGYGDGAAQQVLGEVLAGTVEGDAIDGEWEYRPVQLPGEVSRLTAAVRLQIQAEYSGWELSRVRLYPGGVRKVVLRRRRSSFMLPGLSF